MSKNPAQADGEAWHHSLLSGLCSQDPVVCLSKVIGSDTLTCMLDKPAFHSWTSLQEIGATARGGGSRGRGPFVNKYQGNI